MSWFWNMELINSPVQAVVVAITLALALVVLWVARGRKRRHPRWWVFLTFAAAASVVLTGVVLICQRQDAFDGPLPEGSLRWVIGAGGLVGLGLLGICCRPWWGRVLSVVLIVGALLSMGLQVNRLYGLTNTPALIIGMDTEGRIVLPRIVSPNRADRVTVANWKPPAGMPSSGRIGALSGPMSIPASQPYVARSASVYLPPAALVKHPPRLLVMVTMSGQPGTPSPAVVSAELNNYAAQHHGLAPIAVVVDQLAGNKANDPICMDSAKFGAVSNYVNVDVVAYIKKHFNVLPAAKDWAIAGYSNGGACAMQYGTEFPQIWGAVLDVSGNEYPGSEHVARHVRQLWNGDQAAYEAWLPLAQMRRHTGQYAGHLASFTWGGDDHRYGPGQQSNATAATAAGFTVQAHSIPGVKHVGAAARDGYALVVSDFAHFTGLDRR